MQYLKQITALQSPHHISYHITICSYD